MPKRTTSYNEWLVDQLADPDLAMRYIDAAQDESPSLFQKALRKVAIAQERSPEAVLKWFCEKSLDKPPD